MEQTHAYPERGLLANLGPSRTPYLLGCEREAWCYGGIEDFERMTSEFPSSAGLTAGPATASAGPLTCNSLCRSRTLCNMLADNDAPVMGVQRRVALIKKSV